MEEQKEDTDKNYNSDEVRLKLRECLKDIEIAHSDPEEALYSCNTLKVLYDLLISQPPGYRDKLKALEHNLDSSTGIHKRITYYKTLVFILYLINYPRIEEHNLPSKVRYYLKKDFQNILELVSDDKSKFHTFNNYSFLSYMEKLGFSRIPLGCQDIIICGFSRRWIIQKSISRISEFIKLLVEMKGNKPLFELHHNPHRFRQFNPGGWQEVFQLGAQMLLQSPKIKGIFGVAWFFDPQIKEISPELYYIQELIESIGGHFFFVDESEFAKRDAFSLSRSRRVAYEEGRYVPRNYIAVIPRKALLDYYGLINARVN